MLDILQVLNLEKKKTRTKIKLRNHKLFMEVTVVKKTSTGLALVVVTTAIVEVQTAQRCNK